MNYVIIMIIFAVLGFVFGALIYFVQYKISRRKEKPQDETFSPKDD
jgi:heme/copper-type cytochrome/quinol oxidase subunit 2